MTAYDRRLFPHRSDLAAAHLRGMIDAPAYADGAAMQVVISAATLRARPDTSAPQETQLLFGEDFTVYESRDGWAWGQARLDGYVGYVRAEALGAPVAPATHRVSALRTYVFAEADLKSQPLMLLSLNARVRVVEESGRWRRLARGGWAADRHLRGLDERALDWVAEAERFLGTPYLWGGRESLGLDCSGLIQTALHAAGRPCPRDSDMQQRELGETLDAEAPLRRGDIVFWKGHVGVMASEGLLLHANAHHLQTALEPLAEAAARIEPLAGPITRIARLP